MPTCPLVGSQHVSLLSGRAECIARSYIPHARIASSAGEAIRCLEVLLFCVFVEHENGSRELVRRGTMLVPKAHKLVRSGCSVSEFRSFGLDSVSYSCSRILTVYCFQGSLTHVLKRCRVLG